MELPSVSRAFWANSDDSEFPIISWSLEKPARSRSETERPRAGWGWLKPPAAKALDVFWESTGNKLFFFGGVNPRKWPLQAPMIQGHPRTARRGEM